MDQQVADDDALWRRLSTRAEKLSCDSRIGESDEGFFEKFGNLANEKDETEIPDEDVSAPIEEIDDSIEEKEKKELISDFMGLNIDELYSEVLYEIIHMVGSDAESFDKSNVFNYLKEAFKLDEEKHEELLQVAQEKEAPNILLNIEIVEAKDLKPKDPNGLSDPFCTLYLHSFPTHRFHTGVKGETLNPLWEEHFSLPVRSTNSDILRIEVWDFDPAETIKEKVTKIPCVKGVKGLGKLMKEIAATASNGKHDNEIIGTAQIPLKSIPSSGQTKWIQLEKKPKSGSQGNVKLKLAFGSQKNNFVACQEYRHILRLLFLHELDVNKTEPNEWNGQFSDVPAAILRQHASQSGLNQYHLDMAHWVEFTKFHSNHQLNMKIYSSLLTSISAHIKEDLYSDDEIKMFWEGVKKLLPSIYTHIKLLKKINPKDKLHMEQTTSVLKILSYLCSERHNENIDLFSEDIYGWLDIKSNNENTIHSVLIEAIKQSSIDWFQQVVDTNLSSDSSTENQLRQAIKVTQSIRNDLQKSVEYFDKLFISAVNIDYAKIIYPIYEEKIVELVEPLVLETCKSLKPIKIKNEEEGPTVNDNSVATGTSLFELYLQLQKLSLLGAGLFNNASVDFKINKFHNWFYHGVAKWLDIAVYKAIARIEKAIELDELTPVDSTVKYSSSAVDTLSIFYQIKIFWTQLSWPDVEGSFTFAAKILDDLCRCCVYYADNMGKKVEYSHQSPPSEFLNGNIKQFKITSEWCLAINNIDYVKTSIQPFAKDLGVHKILTKLSDFRNQTTADNCEHTLNLVLENTVDIVGNKIIGLLEVLSNKMAPYIKRMIREGCDLTEGSDAYMDKLMQYLDESLMTFHSQLNSLNFERILSIIWNKVCIILSEVINEAIEKKKSAYFYRNLDKAVQLLVHFFQDVDKSLNIEEIDYIKNIIKIQSMDTSDLIDQYILERISEQKSLTKALYGMLTVKVAFLGETLNIEVLNARNLPPHDSNGLCDPFVKIVLLPKEDFPNVTHLKTKTHKKNLFPLFEETFKVELSKEKKYYDNGVIHFIVKDQDFLYFNEFVGEAFIPFSEIVTLENGDKSANQIHLTLSKPTEGSKILKVIDQRQGEKLARDFVKKQRKKMGEKKLFNKIRKFQRDTNRNK